MIRQAGCGRGILTIDENRCLNQTRAIEQAAEVVVAVAADEQEAERARQRQKLRHVEVLGNEIRRYAFRMPDLDQPFEAAIAAVADACKVCEKVRRNLVQADEHGKADRSPVTIADFASQAVIIKALSSLRLPTVAEESVDDFDAASQDMQAKAAEAAGMSVSELREHIAGGSGEPSGRYWVLDPIDGTKGYLRGGHYAVALAMIDNGRPVLGVLGCPRWDIGRIFGGSSDGAWTATIERPDLRQPVTAVGTNDVVRLTESVESGHADHATGSRVADAIGATEEPLRMDSQAKYAAVASGEADVYFRLSPGASYVEKVWDHAAGVAVVEAAGGRVTDTTGKPLDFTQGRTLVNNRGIIATGGPESLHERVLEAVRSST